MNAYEKFQLDWMKSHGYSILDLIQELDDYREDETTSIVELFNNWERDRGFDGSIWPCLEEADDAGDLEAYYKPEDRVSFPNHTNKKEAGTDLNGYTFLVGAKRKTIMLNDTDKKPLYHKYNNLYKNEETWHKVFGHGSECGVFSVFYKKCQDEIKYAVETIFHGSITFMAHAEEIEKTKGQGNNMRKILVPVSSTGLDRLRSDLPKAMEVAFPEEIIDNYFRKAVKPKRGDLTTADEWLKSKYPIEEAEGLIHFGFENGFCPDIYLN